MNATFIIFQASSVTKYPKLAFDCYDKFETGSSHMESMILFS